MDCRIVFYTAVKTSLCEKAVKKGCSAAGLKISGAVFATDRQGMGRQLCEALSMGDPVFLIGGLGFSDRRNAADILASAASNANVEELYRVETGGDDGYLLRAGDQLLVLLPDDPGQIEAALSGALGEYLRLYAAGK